jgi:hypothetical protein
VNGSEAVATLTARWSLMAAPCAVAGNRRRILQQLRQWHYDVSEECADTVLLLSSELLTNGIQHSNDDLLTVAMCGREDEVFIAVLDGSPEHPQLQHVGARAEGGRGLELVEALAHSWGTQATPGGKAVWMTLKIRRLPAPATESGSSAQSRIDLLAKIRDLAPRVRVRTLSLVG